MFLLCVISVSSLLACSAGVDFAVKRMTLHDCNVKVTLWDTAGQERFRTLTTTFYRGAKGIIFGEHMIGSMQCSVHGLRKRNICVTYT